MPSHDDVDQNAVGLPRGRVLVLAVLVEGGMLAAAFGFAWLIGVDLLEGAAVTGRAGLLALALTAPLLVVVLAATRSSWFLFKQIREDLEHVLPMFRNCTVPDLLLMSVLAGAGEEALFRGVLQPVAADALGVVPGLVVASAVFGLVHLVSVPYAIFAGAMGLYLGAIQLYTGNLFVPAAVHALYDFGALVYLVRIGANSEQE